MTQQELQPKLELCLNWVRDINHWFKQCEGDVFNNKEFWDQCIHSKSNDDFWALIAVHEQLKLEYPDICDKYYRCDLHLRDVELLLHKRGNQPIQQPGRMGKNKSIFAGLMNFKDILNEVTNTAAVKGKPKSKKKTVVVLKQKPRPILSSKLFDIGE